MLLWCFGKFGMSKDHGHKYEKSADAFMMQIASRFYNRSLQKQQTPGRTENVDIFMRKYKGGNRMSVREQVHQIVDAMSEEQLNGFISLFGAFITISMNDEKTDKQRAYDELRKMIPSDT